MYEIIPGILEKEWSEIEKKLNVIKPFVKTVHIDIIDGKFAPNLTFLDPKPFKAYTSGIFFELHMMVDEPINYIEQFAEAGFRRFLGHVEKMSDMQEFVAKTRLYGEAGLAIDGGTPLDSIQIPYEDLDSLLIMTIKAGFSGQEFVPEYLGKVKAIRQKNPNIPIEVDGGINDQTILLTKQAGANRFAATSYIFRSQNQVEAYRQLEELICK